MNQSYEQTATHFFVKARPTILETIRRSPKARKLWKDQHRKCRIMTRELSRAVKHSDIQNAIANHILYGNSQNPVAQ